LEGGVEVAPGAGRVAQDRRVRYPARVTRRIYEHAADLAPDEPHPAEQLDPRREPERSLERRGDRFLGGPAPARQQSQPQIRPAVSTDRDSARPTGTMNACGTDALSVINKKANSKVTCSDPGQRETVKPISRAPPAAPRAGRRLLRGARRPGREATAGGWCTR